MEKKPAKKIFFSHLQFKTSQNVSFWIQKAKIITENLIHKKIPPKIHFYHFLYNYVQFKKYLQREIR